MGLAQPPMRFCAMQCSLAPMRFAAHFSTHDDEVELVKHLVFPSTREVSSGDGSARDPPQPSLAITKLKSD